MRKILPLIAMLIGAVALFVGIGQKTFWAPPETVTATMPELSGTAPLTVIEPSINDPAIAPVELKIEAEGEFTASLGRSYDVEAWVADAAHVSLTGIDRTAHQLQAELVEGEEQVPNPAGADIFFDSQSAQGEMTYRWTAPDNGSWSLLLAADGKDAAPASISVTYANDDAMPWALPLIIIGALLLIGGLAFLLVRPKKAAPKKTARASHTQHSLALVAVLGLGMTGVLLPAAPADPSDSASASPEQTEQTEQSEQSEQTEQPSGEATESTPEAESEAPDEQTTTTFPVVTEEQLERILSDAKAVVAKADESRKTDELDARAAGGFRWMRDKRYAILNEDVEVAEPEALQTEVIRSAAVPNTSEAKFPRVINVVTAKDDDPNTLPLALTLKQDGARENYKVIFASQMLPASSFPGIAVGDPSVRQLEPEAEGLGVTPKNAVIRLADLLTNKDSKYADNFAESDFIKAIHAGQEAEQEAANEAEVTYARKASEKETWAVSTPDGGAIVTGMINSTTTFERTEDSDPLTSADDLTKALLGSSSTSGNVAINYAEPVMLYIPAAGSEDKIQLIAGEVSLLEVKRIEED